MKRTKEIIVLNIVACAFRLKNAHYLHMHLHTPHYLLSLSLFISSKGTYPLGTL